MIPYIHILVVLSIIGASIGFLCYLHKRKKIIQALQSIKPEISPSLEEIERLFNISHYVTESERMNIDAKYKDLTKVLKEVHQSKEFEKLPEKADYQKLYNLLSDTISLKVENNNNFILDQLEINREYFDHILAYPLDRQQREAIVSLEDNVLVISSAGSGKTMTTVGKVRYLIDKQGIDPKKILLVTFTRKAAVELSQRLGEESLNCVTFHKLALDIIAKATGQKPSLTPADFSMQIYQSLMENNPAFKRAVVELILDARYKMRDLFEYETEKEYIQDRKKYGVKAYFTDMDNRTVFCKSDEESKICDFLGSRGVKFRYEEKYEYPTQNYEHRQYQPDFSIYYTDDDGGKHRIYLEHFAVNKYGHCPKWFSKEDKDKYLKDINWKRSIHKDNNTILIETSSADFQNGDIYIKLEQQLKDCGVKIDYNNINKVSRDIAIQEESIINMITSFNFLMKSQGKSLEEMKKKNYTYIERLTFHQIIVPFITEYNIAEEKEQEIDFTDAIIQATALCNQGFRQDYDYILVDEFQDISLDRYHFLLSLRNTSPLTKLFCVGDDWQSIYRFAGSDMALFKDFSKFFGYTKECRMETTYRFGEPLIGKSSTFIQTNPVQKAKTIHSFDDQALTKIDFIPAKSKLDISIKVKDILEATPPDKSVYLLGRYSFDVNILKGEGFNIISNRNGVSVKYHDRCITYMTVHQAKGLESDYVILLNCNSGTLGFPSEISDNPILRHVLSESDGYEFGEERRVFYVAITRAKLQTYILYDEAKPSPFVCEFVDNLNTNTEEDIPIKELCPKCNCGRVKTLYKGIAINGNPYYVLGCSNQRYGCDYHETRFINLNHNSCKRYRSY